MKPLVSVNNVIAAGKKAQASKAGPLRSKLAKIFKKAQFSMKFKGFSERKTKSQY